jgi:uncharacterized protein (TIGR02271 family)
VASETGDDTERLARIEERVEVGKREVETGRVVLRTRVEERPEIVETEVEEDEVTVERVAVDRPVESMPEVREEDGVLVVPVVEEQLVLTRRLVLKEEIRITRRTRTRTVRESVPLRFERVEIERQEPATRDTHHQEGRPVDDGPYRDRDV